MKVIIDIPERDYDLACKYPNALIATYAHYIKDGTPYDEKVEKIIDMLETEWGYEGIREDVSRILGGGRE